MERREFFDDEDTMELSWGQLAPYLAEQRLGFDAGSRVRQFANGFGNLNFMIEVDGRRCVLRRPPPGPLPPGGNDMSREFRVLSRLWQGFPLAPKAFHLCEDESVLGAPFLLMEYRPGRVIRSTLPEDLSDRSVDLSAMMVDTLASLHELRPEDVDLATFGRPEGFLSRTVEGWIKRADVASDGTPPAAISDIGAWLHDNLLADEPSTLIHNDFKLNNMILDPADPATPIAVLDWDMCTRGDPLFDLATLLSYWTEAGDPVAMHELQQMPTAAPGFLTRQAAAERYADRTGRDLSDFIFYRVLAVFKLGVVFLQLHARYRRGATQDERFAGFRKVAEGLLDFALEVSSGRTF